MSRRRMESSPYKVQVLDRALSIIDALTKVRSDAGLAELAEQVKLHKSTAHRLLSILERHRIVERDSETGRYRLGLRLFELGTIAMDRFNIRDRARPYLETLLEEGNETVHLCALDSGEVLYLDKIEPARSVRMASRIGRRNPVHSTAVGKAILAHLPESEQDRILEMHELHRVTPKTITSISELKAEFKPIRERGYALDNEETELGLRCIGAAVLDHSGRPVAAISLSAPSFRLTMDKVPAVAGSVVRVTRALSEELGFRPAAKRESSRKTLASIR
jgi:IclR family transcriptional regulator, KDG regulon repressor